MKVYVVIEYVDLGYHIREIFDNMSDAEEYKIALCNQPFDKMRLEKYNISPPYDIEAHEL